MPSSPLGTGWGWMEPSTAPPPASYMYVWAWSPTMYSSPRPQWASSPHRLPWVPLVTKRAASLPSSAAVAAWSSLTVGSSPYTSSPTTAVAIAARMAAVGWVTVSERRSIT